jgi:predicted kinase
MPARPASTQPDAVWGRIDTNLDELEDVLGGRSAHLVAQIRACRARLAPECQWLLAMREGGGCLLHGDLRAEHVYDLGSYFVVLDGVAFAEELAVGDPLEDVAFLAMDLGCSLGRWDLVDALWNGWGVTHRTGLCDLYAGHRSLIRAKVACLQHDDEAVARHLVNALVHWETPGRRPVLIGVGGLPGVGKSTVARAAQQALNLTVIRTDVVRKELGPADYSEAGRTAVYDAVLSEARKRLLVGERVVVDASLGKESWRHRVLELGQTMGVPVVLLFVQAPETVATARLAERSGDASDADVRVYHLARDAWERLSPETSRVTVSVQNGGSVETAVSATADALLCRGLCLEA